MDIAALKASAEKATPGPWEVKTMVEWDNGFDFFDGADKAFVFPVDLEPDDTRFIALANPTSILSMIARLEALEEALKPFAEASGDLEDEHPDGWHLWEHAAAMSLSAGDLRRAKAALEPTP